MAWIETRGRQHRVYWYAHPATKTGALTCRGDRGDRG